MPQVVIDARSVVDRRSGIGNYVEALLRHLIPMAPDLHFVLLKHPELGRPLMEHARVREIPFPGETKSVATVLRLGRAHPFTDAGLYHSPADLVPLGLGCPFVVTLHDLMWVEAPELASNFWPVRLGNRLWYSLNIARAVRGARRVIAISEATKAAIERWYPEHSAKVRVVPHGLDHERYAPERAGPREALDDLLPPPIRYALIVGQGSPYKNHVRMIRAYISATADLPDHRLVLVRRFARVDRDMRALLGDARIRSRLVLLEHVDDRRLATLYRHADMLLFASEYEGFGMPALEAMCMGTPVLASTAPAVLEVTGAAALHAVPTDLADLTEKIGRLARDADLRERLVQLGRQRALEFRWEACASATLAVYREVLGRPPPDRAQAL